MNDYLELAADIFGAIAAAALVVTVLLFALGALF